MNTPIDISLLLLLATIFLAWAGWSAWTRTRDPLHPALWLSVLFFLGLVAEPWQCLNHPDILELFPGFDGVAFAMAIQYAGMVCLFLGLLSVKGPRFKGSTGQNILDVHLSAAQKRQLLRLAWVLGILALAAYWLAILRGGGFIAVYSRPKGGGGSLSGYQGEAVNLGVAAMLLYAMAIQGRPLSAKRFFILLLFASPLLLPGFFGGFRGPLFLGMSGMFVTWHVAKGRLPRPRIVALAAAVCLVTIVVVQSQRQHVYIGSGQGYDLSRLWAKIQKEDVHTGDNFVVSTGAVLTHTHTGTYHYGRRFFITFFIRPIPRQLWPNQYDDMARLLYGGGRTYQSVLSSFEESTWDAVVGWRPLGGYAVNSIVDLFAEFSWAYLGACWLLGYGIGWVWAKFRNRGGLWLVYYAVAMVLSIYLPTQSFSAFAHRMLYVCVMTFVISRVVIGYRSYHHRKRRVSASLRQDFVAQAPTRNLRSAK